MIGELFIMNEEQKKRLLIVLMIMGVVGSLAMSIAWFVFLLKDIQDPVEQVKQWLSWGFTNFGSLTLGIILKFLLNKKHLKDIKTLIGGEEMKKIETKLYNGFSFTMNKNNELIIKDTLKRTGIDVINAYNAAMLDYVEDIRKAL